MSMNATLPLEKLFYTIVIATQLVSTRQAVFLAHATLATDQQETQAMESFAIVLLACSS